MTNKGAIRVENSLRQSALKTSSSYANSSSSMYICNEKSKISFFNTEKMLSLFSHLKLNSENVSLRRSCRCRSLKVVIKNLLTRVFFSVATIRGADWGLLCELRFRPI